MNHQMDLFGLTGEPATEATAGDEREAEGAAAKRDAIDGAGEQPAAGDGANSRIAAEPVPGAVPGGSAAARSSADATDGVALHDALPDAGVLARSPASAPAIRSSTSAPPTTDLDPPIDPRALLVIDGTAMLFRAYYGLGSRRAPNGAEVGAVTGVCHQLLGVLRRQPAARVVVVFDAAQETFRNRIDPRYKANRGDPPDDLVPQFDLVKEITNAIGLCTLAKLDFEADDLMATLAALARRAGVPARLVAVDKDLCQAVVDDAPICDLCDPKSDELTDGAGVVRRLGVRPDQVVDLMALTGDSTDNIQGVRGVGPKAAIALLDAFGDLDGIYRNLDRVEFLGIRGAKSLARKLEEGRDDALLARRLVRLDDAVDLELAADDLGARSRWRGPRDDVDPLFADHGLRGPLTGFRRLFAGHPAARHEALA